jgi:hypothetical protein
MGVKMEQLSSWVQLGSPLGYPWVDLEEELAWHWVLALASMALVVVWG